MEKTLTIVIPAYNIGDFIDEDLPTFLENDILDDIEVLIVNDGSKDNTAEKAREYESRYPNTVKLVNKENGGHGSTINKGIELASGKYFKVVDGDDWVDTRGFKVLVGFLKESSQEYDMIVNPYNEVFESSGKTKKIEFQDVPYGEYTFREIAGKASPIAMHAITFRTEMLKNNHIRLDENKFYVDTEYILYPMPYVKRILFREECIYQYRLAIEGQSVNPANLIKNRNMHKEVLFSLVDFYNQYIVTDIANENVKVYIKKRIAEMIDMQINIFSFMSGNKQDKNELIEFESQLRQRSKELYNAANSKKVQWLRRTNYQLYPLIARFYRKKMGI